MAPSQQAEIVSRTRKKTWNRILGPIIGNDINIYFNVSENPRRQRERISTLTSHGTKFPQHSNSNIAEKFENNLRESPIKTLESVLLKTERSPDRDSDSQTSEENSPLLTSGGRPSIKLPLLKILKQVETPDTLSPVIQKTGRSEDFINLNSSRIDNYPEIQSSKLLGGSPLKNIVTRFTLNNISKAKTQPDINSSSKIRSIVWTIVFPFILERTVEQSTEKLRKESQLKASKQIEDQSRVLMNFIEKHCGPALSKLYKTKNSCIIVDDGTTDGPIFEKELNKRFNMIIVNLISASIKVIDEIN